MQNLRTSLQNPMIFLHLLFLKKLKIHIRRLKHMLFVYFPNYTLTKDPKQQGFGGNIRGATSSGGYKIRGATSSGGYKTHYGFWVWQRTNQF